MDTFLAAAELSADTAGLALWPRIVRHTAPRDTAKCFFYTTGFVPDQTRGIRCGLVSFRCAGNELVLAF